MSAEGREFSITTHPAYEQRIEHFVSMVDDTSTIDSPPWLVYVYNVIRMATEPPTDAEFSNYPSDASESKSLSARVLPLRYAHLGNFDALRENHWVTTIARLLLGESRIYAQVSGSFEKFPEAATALYRGLLEDDLGQQDLCKRALISIEPIYEQYLPRLMEQFNETAMKDQREAYISNLANYLYVTAAAELGEERVNMDPRIAEFFHGSSAGEQ